MQLEVVMQMPGASIKWSGPEILILQRTAIRGTAKGGQGRAQEATTAVETTRVDDTFPEQGEWNTKRASTLPFHRPHRPPSRCGMALNPPRRSCIHPGQESPMAAASASPEGPHTVKPVIYPWLRRCRQQTHRSKCTELHPHSRGIYIFHWALAERAGAYIAVRSVRASAESYGLVAYII